MKENDLRKLLNEMTLEEKVGQMPIYYNRFATGRPNPMGDKNGYVNSYIDESI